jgi:choline-sulfatase
VRLAGLRLHLPEAAPAGSPAETPPAAATPPNLVVYLVDTLRADHLGVYGYPRPTSPEIDRFARQSVRWIEARAQSPWTRPSVATILTGLLPISHGVERVSDAMSQSVETLGERLQAAGYETALFTTNANITPRLGFAQGWDHYAYLVERRGRRKVHFDSLEVNQAVFDWLAKRREPARPFFLVVHTLDPHDAYLPRERFWRSLAPEVPIELGCCAAMRELPYLEGDAALARAAQLRQLYDAEVAQNDAAFGELLGELERRGLGESTAVMLLSDHGEEFYDHGRWKHGWTLYEEVLRIPLLLRLPGRAHAGAVLPGPVDQIDVAPTLLELAGAPVPAELPGTSLLAELRGVPRPPRVSLAWLKRGEEMLASAALQQWKLIRRDGAWIPPAGLPPYQLFGLASDPRERDDLALARRVRREWLIGQLRSGEARYLSGDAAESIVLDPELEEALRALGYL